MWNALHAWAVPGLALGLVLVGAYGAEPASAPRPWTPEQIMTQLQHYEDGKWVDPSGEKPSPREMLRRMQALSDQQLEKVMADPTKLGASIDELCLTEVVRRGGPHWESVLKSGLQDGAPAATAPDPLLEGSSNVTLLTALRRVQKKTDPLVILVTGKAEIKCHVGYLPVLMANLTNLDSERTQVKLELGGDYRGASRSNKWRIQVVDADGHVLPEREDEDMGGFVHFETLEYGESVPMRLPVAAYVDVSKPGTYTVTVLYHPFVRIGNVSSVDGLVCCHSLPLKMVVEPVKIETTDEEQNRAAALILKLPANGPLHILGGAYNEQAAGDFMPKDSPAAQLLQLEWKAVPELIRAVNGKTLNPTQRAWALGLLFSITDHNDPTQTPDVVGPFEYRYSGWVLYGGGPGMQSVSQKSVSMPEGKIDAKAQMEFARRWLVWIDQGYIAVIKPGTPR